MSWHQSEFAKNFGPELNNLALQTYEIFAQNSFGENLSSKNVK